MTLRNKIILVIIVVVAAFLRFFQLGTNPPSLTWDEAAWGYNAYSIGIDGRDEFGRLLPYDYLESFGDFKPPMYAYLSVVPVKVFGLNEFSTRFASAFFGTLTVLVTFFLVKNIIQRNNLQIPLIAASLLAISPWHIMLSRAAFEANVATFFLACGVWLFLVAMHRKPMFLLLSVASFVASIYTFNSARVVAPILLIGLSFGYLKSLWTKKRVLILAIILGGVMVLPIAKFLLSPQASLRFKEVNIFSDIDVVKTSNQEIANDNNAIWSKIIHNRRFAYTTEVIKHYFDNLSPNFLFINGDRNPKFSTQDTGQMYIWEFPFLIFGIFYLIKNKEGSWWIVPFWLLIGIIPASLARETPHALRTEAALPTFQILSACGIYGLFAWVKRGRGFLEKYRKVIVSTFLLIVFLNLSYFLHGYYFHYPTEQSGEWQYGYKESLNYVKEQESQYDKIYFTNFLGRPYIYALFYNQYDPKQFRKEAVIKRDAFGFVNVVSFGKYSFPDILPTKNVGHQKILLVNSAFNIPKGVKPLKTFYQLNHFPILAAYKL